MAFSKRTPTATPVAPVRSTVRAARRAYDGAPPVIPHAPQGASCVVCHTPEGKTIPGMGLAPANPHHNSRRGANLQNCRQCHLFVEADRLLVGSGFAGLPQSLAAGERAYAGAPPAIPHALLLRENCLACHAGPAVRPEIRCSHPQRSNCTQCHLARDRAIE